MKVTDLDLEGLKLIEIQIHGDERGFFAERFRKDRLEDAGIPASRFVQDNHSRSAPGVLRGLHYQVEPPQGKLVGCTRGRIWDVAVDIRPKSKTFGKWFSAELSDLNGRLLWIPAGFAHGFYVLGDEPADLLYKVDGYYNKKTEGGLVWNDPDLEIQWPTKSPQLSPRDSELSTFKEYSENPPAWSF